MLACFSPQSKANKFQHQRKRTKRKKSEARGEDVRQTAARSASNIPPKRRKSSPKAPKSSQKGSWRLLEGLLAAPGASWRRLGGSWGSLSGTWAALGAVLEALGPLLAALGGALGGSWGALGPPKNASGSPSNIKPPFGDLSDGPKVENKLPALGENRF